MPYKKMLQNPQGLALTDPEADLPSLCFLGFLPDPGYEKRFVEGIDKAIKSPV